MARPKWTPEHLERARILYLTDHTHAQIGEALGFSAQTIMSRLCEAGITSRLSMAARQSRRKSAPKMTKARRAKIAAKQKANYEANPEGHGFNLSWEERSHGSRKGWVKRRGYAVPADKADEYRWLQESKQLSAPEAARVLGITKGGSNAGA